MKKLSAFEHQCTPNDGDTQVGNLIGWHQLRHEIEKEFS